MSNVISERPKFSAAAATTSAESVAVSSQEADTRLSELIEQRRTRPEIGAIWVKQAKTSSMEFLKIRLRLTRQQLLSLLEKTPDTTVESELPIYELVAFPNSSSNENNKRPAFRIHEARE